MPVKLTNNSARIIAKLQGAVRDSLEELGAEIVEEIQQTAPKKSGDLSESYQYEIEGDKLTIGTDSPYAIPAEFGTHNWAGKPHFRPAMFNAEDELPQKIKRKMI